MVYSLNKITQSNNFLKLSVIIRNTIIRAVKKVKTKGKFDYEMFCQDLQNVTEN